MADINLDLKKLNKFIESLSSVPEIRVGIMGDDNARDDGGSNATIGAIHEFGLGHMPKRSFLRVPLMEGLSEAVDKNITKKDLDGIVENESLVPICRKIGMIAEGVVFNAFATQGGGNWPKWKNGYKSKTGMILQNDQQLAKSISSAVIEE